MNMRMMSAPGLRLIGVLTVVGLAGLVVFAAQQAWRDGAAPVAGPSSASPGLTTGTGQAEGDAPAVIRFVKDPTPVPEFTVRDLDGQEIASADWRGKVTIVNFWATWCVPCLQEIPDFIALQEKYRDHLQIVGLSMDEGPADQVREFVQEHKINYRVAVADADVGAQFGGVFGLPTTFVVDPQGLVVQKHMGLISPAVYEQEVRALAGLPVDAVVETFEDTGQVFLSNAAHATTIPGLDLSGLIPDQRQTALQRLNAESCTCGCGLTLAQCRINDTSCGVSLPLAKQMVDDIVRGSA
jgi:thiol-disulfide isomerase/thioredoxin